MTCRLHGELGHVPPADNEQHHAGQTNRRLASISTWNSLYRIQCLTLSLLLPVCMMMPTGQCTLDSVSMRG